MNPLRQDDPRHVNALEVAANALALELPANYTHLDIARTTSDAYFTALKEQGVVLVEAYAGDDAGRT